MTIRVVVLTVLPQCQFCSEVAHYDFRGISTSQWIYGCEKHWREFRATNGLGLGEGQLILSANEIRKMASKLISRDPRKEEDL